MIERGFVTVSRIAIEHDVHPNTVRRWLEPLEKKYASRVVVRLGSGPRAKMLTSVEALRGVGATWLPEGQAENDVRPARDLPRLEGRFLGTSEIAKMHDVAPRTARRWLRALERRHGARVVF